MLTRTTFAVRVRRLAYRAAWVVLGIWWFVRRPHTHGVKLVIRDGDEVLFVRHSYGRRREWELPGGGVKAHEGAPEAASREAEEELGLRIDRWTPLGEVVSENYATACLACFTAEYDRRPLRVDPVEIEEVRWGQVTAPPQPLGPHAAKVLRLPGVTGGGTPKPPAAADPR